MAQLEQLTELLAFVLLDKLVDANLAKITDTGVAEIA